MRSREFDDITLDNPPGSGKSESSKTLSSTDSVGGQGIPGTILRVKIHTANWDKDGDYSVLDCGAFEIDACDLDGPPNIFNIKAVSTPISSSMRREEKCRAWEDVTLQKIAQDIAGNAKFKLMYEVEENIELDRVDQLQEADLEFLQNLCRDYGIALKVTNDTIVLFDEATYEKRPAVETFRSTQVYDGKVNPTGRILKFKFSQDTSDTVSSSKVSYKDPKSGKLVAVTFEPPNAPPTGQAINNNERPGNLSGDPYREALNGNGSSSRAVRRGGMGDTIDDFSDIRADATDTAMKKAKAKAREKNKHEWNADLIIVGNTRIVAGVTVNIEGFGVYDGKYYVEETTHTVGNGYTTSFKAHRVLEGY